MANFTLLVFLSLRNTPLAPLSGNSYEKLRPLHKIAGYTTIVTALIHGLRYVISFHEVGLIDEFKKSENFAGPIAGIGMLLMGISTIGWFVRQSYEGTIQKTVAKRGLSLTEFNSLVPPSRYLIPVGHRRHRLPPAALVRSDDQNHHHSCLSLVHRSSPPFCKNMLEFRGQLCNPYSNGRRCRPSQTPAEPPLSPWVARLPVDSVYSFRRDSPFYTCVEQPV